METQSTFLLVTASVSLLGFFLQAALIIGPKINKKNFAVATSITVMAFMLSIVFLQGRLYTSEIGSVLILPLLVFFLFLLIFFMDEIIPVLSLQTVLFFTIIFWFVLLSSFNNIVNNIIMLWWDFLSFSLHGENFFLYIFLGISLIPPICTIWTLFLAFTNRMLGFYSKILSYFWVLIIVIFLMMLQNQSYELNIPSLSTNLMDNGLKLGNALITGMFILQLTSYVGILIFVLPEFNRFETIEDSWYKWRKKVLALIRRFSDYRLPRLLSFRLALLQISILVINYYIKIIPAQTMIALLAIFSMQPITGKGTDDGIINQDIRDEVANGDEHGRKDFDAERENLKALVSKEMRSIEAEQHIKSNKDI